MDARWTLDFIRRYQPVAAEVPAADPACRGWVTVRGTFFRYAEVDRSYDPAASADDDRFTRVSVVEYLDDVDAVLRRLEGFGVPLASLQPVSVIDDYPF